MTTFIVCALDERGCEERGFGPARAGQYLAYFDPNECDGFGRARWTSLKSEAKAFPDLGAAFAEWKRPSTARPIRDDGHPNRPLSAYTITFEQSEDFLDGD